MSPANLVAAPPRMCFAAGYGASGENTDNDSSSSEFTSNSGSGYSSLVDIPAHPALMRVSPPNASGVSLANTIPSGELAPPHAARVITVALPSAASFSISQKFPLSIRKDSGGGKLRRLARRLRSLAANVDSGEPAIRMPRPFEMLFLGVSKIVRPARALHLEIAEGGEAPSESQTSAACENMRESRSYVLKE
ncbi:hypothetical protein C8R43DRAFT_1113258 [Mycena crocata]|nr:hypothetical protein C8R43DRAFT_1113258 [Mycena crocata]